MVSSAMDAVSVEAALQDALDGKEKAEGETSAAKAKIGALDALFDELRMENQQLLEGIAASYRCRGVHGVHGAGVRGVQGAGVHGVHGAGVHHTGVHGVHGVRGVGC